MKNPSILHRCVIVMLFQTFRIANEEGSGHKFAMIIDGMSLAFALTEHSSILRKLCRKCAAVLCCRMTPLQKAEVCYSLIFQTRA